MPNHVVQTAGSAGVLKTLKSFANRATKTVPVERCELCSAPLARRHQHLIDPTTRKIACACDACSMLFDTPGNGRYRRVPRDTRWLTDFRLSDVDWDNLLIPINAAFLFHSSAASKVIAIYPSPAGPMESLLALEAWQEIAEHNPRLQSMAPDIEALLINRLGSRRGFAEHQYFLAPIDECYKFVGLVRGHWRGLSGGDVVWQQISEYFASLTDRSVRASSQERPHAAT